MLSPNLGNPIPCAEHLGEKDYRPVILRMSKESGMLNSMTESSFSLLFSRSSSSCNRKHPAQRGRGTAKGPLSPWKEEMPEQTPNRSSRTISACFTVRGKPSKRKPFLQGGESRLFSISSTTISSLTCREERWVHGQEGHPDFYTAACRAAELMPVPRLHQTLFTAVPGPTGSSHSTGHCS